MGSIKSTIQLIDQFSDPFSAIVNTVNSAIPVVDQFADTMNQQIDTTSIQSVEDQLNATTAAAQELNAAMQNVSSPSVQSPDLNLDEVTVPINPVITEQPELNLPDDITVPINPTVDDVQVDIPDIIIPVDVEQPEIDTSIFQSQIDSISGMMQNITSIQDTINARASSISVLPDDTKEKLTAVNEDIQRMNAQLTSLQNNPLNLDAATVQQQIETLNNGIISTINSQRELNAELQALDIPTPEPPPPVTIPVVWQSDNLEVFTNTGVDRFKSEIQSANQMLNTLNSTQNRIAQQAANTNIFPANMLADMNGMQNRLQAIQNRIQQIENNPINLGSDAANEELEQLRSQLDQAVSEQQALNDAVDRMDVQGANDAYLRLSNTVRGTERYIRDNVNEQGTFNRLIQQGAENASDLQNMIAKALGAFAGVAGIRKAFSFIEDCTDAFNTQLNAETQLISVLANMLDEDYVSQFELETTADTSGAIDEINNIQNSIEPVEIQVSAETKALTTAFDQVKEKASEIQSKGIYGDESMIAAGAEFATYFTDVDAITTMMDTLSNYAMGMSGGGELDTSAMVDYATNLGKIMTGAYDAMTKKGFEFTDAQKAVIEGTATEAQLLSVLGDGYADMSSDMQAAATISQVIDESWSGLYENMSNTPQGKIIQLTNTWGDMKEVIGKQLYPFVVKLIDTISNNWGTITAIIEGITAALQTMLGVIDWLLEGAIAFAGFVIDNWSLISPVVGAVAAALAVYYGWQLAVNAIEVISAAIKGALTIAEYAHAAATGAEVSATAAATAAQMGLNTALLACPITWIIVLIIALVALLYIIVGAINQVAGTSISATGIITGCIATIGAYLINTVGVIWNVVAALVEFLINVWSNPEYAIKAFLVNIALAFLNFDLAIVEGTTDAIAEIIAIWQALVQSCENIIAAIWNFFSGGVEAVVNAWNDGIYLIKGFFISLASNALGVAQSIAQAMGDAASSIANVFVSAINVIIGGINGLINAINKIPGVHIDNVSELEEVDWDFGASAIGDGIEDLNNSLGDAPDKWTAPTLEYGDIGDAYEQGKVTGKEMANGLQDSLRNSVDWLNDQIADKPENYVEIPKFDYINLTDAAAAGYEFGEGIDQSLANFDPNSLFGTTDIPSPEDYASQLANNAALNNIGSDVGDIADGTDKITDKLDITEEDLKYLRDIAEQETINRFTTAEIHIEQTNNNTINSDMDLDGVVDGLTDAMDEAVEILSEGVHT